ncbi:MAG: hypothetical protein H7A35_09330 [Planctomycetales bacterium]|nr:hypothetical protein [bacterium]UNM07080.1 MAG: hypothetical protein H7A35_09330 [Planctomycetales bacterium]
MNWVRLMGVLVLGAGIWGMTGCGSGKAVDANSGNPQVAPPQALEAATLSRLLVNGDGTQTSVKGTVSIKDFTVLANGASQPSQLDMSTGILVRVIDPGDDILVAGNPDGKGDFELLINGDVLLSRLEVEFRVTEDIDGDGTPGDTVRQTVPLFLEQGRVHTVKMEISKASALKLDPALEPEQGEVLIAAIDKLDRGGHLATELAQIPSSGSLVSDFDRDGFIEPGDDVSFDDANFDGTADPLETPVNAGEGSAALQTILGTVVSVSEERGRISIRDNSGNIVNISVSYFTPVERFVVSSQGGEFFSLAITELAERGVQVTGYFDSGVFNALSVNTF